MLIADKSKKVALKIIEGASAVLMVLLCFMLFTDLVEFIFPTSLIHSQLPGSYETAVLTGNADWRHLLIERNGTQSDLDTDGHLTAKVTRLVNDLKFKRAASVAWETGREGLALFNQDSVQTLDHSSAWIQFDRNSTVRLGERTLITIKRFEEDLLLDDQRTFLLLLQGSLRSRVGGTGSGAGHLRLQTPGIVVYMHSDQSPTETRVVVDKNKSATIAVYQGKAQIAVKGERIQIDADRAVRIPAGGPPSAPVALPSPVIIRSPQDGKQYIDKGRHVQIDFDWQRLDDATAYHFMLSRDRSFSQMVADEYSSINHMSLAALTPGRYYWRVSAASGEIEGQYSKLHHFYIVSQLPPPVLNAQQPPEKIFYRNQAPSLRFAWSPAAGASAYHWQLAHDPAFKKVVAERTARSTGLTYKGLAPGTYFWRVSVPGSDRLSSRYSDIRRLEVIQDREPPVLEVQFPVAPSNSRTYLVTGRTETDVKVYVGGFPAEVTADGRFSHALQLRPGKNVIAVAAVDKANNVTSRSEIVYCKE